MQLYAAAFAARSAAVTQAERSAALELLHEADVNALSVNDKADDDIVGQSIWTATIKGSDRPPLEGIRAFKKSKGSGKFRFQMQRVVFGARVVVNIGLTTTTQDLEMVLDIGDGRSETVIVTLTKQPA